MKTIAGVLEIAGALQEVVRRSDFADILSLGAHTLLRADTTGVQWTGPGAVFRTVGKTTLPSAPPVHATGFVCPVGPEGQFALLAVRQGRRFTRTEHALLDALRAHALHVMARILECEDHAASQTRAAECLAAANVGILFRTAQDEPLRSAGSFADDLLATHSSDVAHLLARVTARLGAFDAQTGHRVTEWTETEAWGTLRFRVATASDGDLVIVEEIDCEAGNDAPAALGLPPRQAEVLHWMSKGKSYPEIAAILGISLHTVHDHVAALFRRLGVRDRHSAVRRLRVANESAA